MTGCGHGSEEMNWNIGKSTQLADRWELISSAFPLAIIW